MVCDGDEVVAVCAVTLTEEPSYNHLEEGQWLTPVRCSYAAIHRVAVSAKHRGREIPKFLFDSAAAMAKQLGAISVRVDTHPENIPMQRSLAKAGFVKCGAITLLTGDEAGDGRWVYERLL